MRLSKQLLTWKQAPFIRIIIPFIIGIIICWYQPLQQVWITGFTVSILLLLIVSFLLPLQVKYYYGYLQGLLIHFLLLATGASLLFEYKAPNNPEWIGHFATKDSFVYAEVMETPAKKTKSFKMIVNSLALELDHRSTNTQGLILLYVQQSDSAASIEKGDRIMFRANCQPIRSGGNPGAFDYSTYLSYANVYIQSYATSNQWVAVSKRTQSTIDYWLSQFQSHILSTIKKLIPGPKEQGLAEALLIGYKNDLDKDLLQAYSNTGVVHVIAISGLHLGLIYWLLNLLFFPFRKNKKATLPISILVLVGLWVFSLLSGASPSVLRSAVMFSFIIIGKCGSRKISVFNSLCASACFLLCFNPCWVWDLGFQLSYIAVLSIVLFMKPIYHLLFIKNKLLDLLWQLCAVTLAAQILTTPLSIYQFHQFPMMFLFTNLVAVPLSSLILLGEVLLVSINGIDFLSPSVGKIIQWLIQLMNNYVEYMNDFPGSTWKSLSISIVQSILLYICIIGLYQSFQQKKKYGLYVGILSLLGFYIDRTYSVWKAKQQELLIVYNIPNTTAMDLVRGQETCFIGQPAVAQDKRIIQQYLYPARTRYRIVSLAEPPDSGILEVNGKKILLVDKNVYQSTTHLIPEVDFVILTKNAGFSLETLQTRVVFKHLVLDGSISAYTVRRWKKQAAASYIPCTAVTEDGAFVIK